MCWGHKKKKHKDPGLFGKDRGEIISVAVLDGKRERKKRTQDLGVD